MNKEDKLKNVLGKKLISFQMEKVDGAELVDSLELVFENGYSLTVYTGWEPYDQTWLELIIEKVGE